jgi:hypothetical protein
MTVEPYGPTETAVWSVAGKVVGGYPCIGLPMENPRCACGFEDAAVPSVYQGALHWRRWAGKVIFASLTAGRFVPALDSKPGALACARPEISLDICQRQPRTHRPQTTRWIANFASAGPEIERGWWSSIPCMGCCHIREVAAEARPGCLCHHERDA